MDPMTCILKYVIVGDSAVGKSSILLRLTDDRFAETEPTLGVEFGSRILEIGKGSEGKRVKVQCWDTAGTETFRSITRSYFRGAAGALLVYDVTRKDSFEHVTSWLEDLRSHADENVDIILVANKIDLVAPTSISPDHGVSSTEPSPSDTTPQESAYLPRAISAQMGKDFAAANGLLYVETSAKEGWGVFEAFERTAKEVLKRHAEEGLRRGKGGRSKNGLKLDSDPKTSSGGCC